MTYAKKSFEDLVDAIINGELFSDKTTEMLEFINIRIQREIEKRNKLNKVNLIKVGGSNFHRKYFNMEDREEAEERVRYILEDQLRDGGNVDARLEIVSVNKNEVELLMDS